MFFSSLHRGSVSSILRLPSQSLSSHHFIVCHTSHRASPIPQLPSLSPRLRRVDQRSAASAPRPTRPLEGCHAEFRSVANYTKTPSARRQIDSITPYINTYNIRIYIYIYICEPDICIKLNISISYIYIYIIYIYIYIYT